MSNTIICPIGGLFSVDATSSDQAIRDVTFHFGLFAPYSILTDPSPSLPTKTINRGGGTGVLTHCARSGNNFPASRMRRDGTGRTVGDIFNTRGDPK